MATGIDFFQEVTFPTAGVDKRDEDALECLLALCRIIGLRYKLVQTANGKFDAYVAGDDWPTDFYVPYSRTFQRIEIGHDSAVDALRSAIRAAVGELLRNGESFRHWYLYFKEKMPVDYG